MKFKYAFLLAALVIAAFTSMLHAAEPWDVAFADDPKAIQQAAKNVMAAGSHEAIVLLEDHQYKIDGTGRTTSTLRKVVRVASQDAVDGWSSIEQGYEPWHEQKPQMRARVITAGGATHWLDPGTISDEPGREFGSAMFSDRRVMRAPLPAVAAGAVIEYEITSRETAPFFTAGVTRRLMVIDSVPLERFHLSIEAGKDLPLRTAAMNIPPSAIRSRTFGAITRVECELGPLAVRKEFEGNLPSNVSNYPYFSFSTGKSWQAIAASYEAIVDQQIGASDLKSLLEGIDLTGSKLAVATRLAAKLHKEIRYTGLEFGEAAIVPSTPQETMKRKYGDCKDKAAMLAAMLRAVGIKAYLALLSSGYTTDVDADLPGLGVFNHAIVYVEGTTPLWIDAAAMETRVGELPAGDQGRFALIASGATTELVKTPEASSQNNLRTHSIEILMSNFGPGEIRESLEAYGSQEATMRSLYEGGGEKKTKEALEHYVKRDFAAKSLGQFTVTSKQDFNEPFRMTLQALNAGRAITSRDDGVVVLSPGIVFQALPYELTAGLQSPQRQEKRVPRKHSFVFSEPHRLEYRYKIVPPVLFKLKTLPASSETKIGPASYSRTYQRNSDESVEVVYRFDTQKRTLSAGEFEAFRDALREQYQASPEVFQFVSEVSEYLALGETGKALALVRKSLLDGGNQLTAQIRLSRLLVTSGAVQEAIGVAKRAIDVDGTSSQAWQALAWAYQHDDFGRRFRGNWNLSASERCYRKAIELDGNEITPRMDLAILLEHNEKGQRYGKGARLDDAVAAYRECIKLLPNSPVHENLAIVLLYEGRYAEAREEAKKVADTPAQRYLLAAVTAITDGAASAVIESRANFANDRSQSSTLLTSAAMLIQLRRYDLALDLSKSAARIPNASEFPGRIELLGKLKRYEDAQLATTDPGYPVQRLIRELFSELTDLPRLDREDPKPGEWNYLKGASVQLKQNAAEARAYAVLLGLLPQHILDFAVGLMEFDKEGDDTRGYRIRAHLPVNGNFLVAYVVREEGQYKIIGSTDSPDIIGRRVLRLLEDKDIKTAQWWLDRISADLPADRMDGTGGPAIRFLWSGVTEASRGPEVIRIAANSLIGRYSYSEKAIQFLKEARPKAPNPLEKAQLDFALCESLEKAEKWDELLLVARRLAAFQTFANDAFQFIVTATTGAKHWKELQAEAERRLKTAPDDMPALRAMATCMLQSGNGERAADFMKRMTASPFAGLEEQEFEAWNAMLIGKADPSILSKIRKAQTPGAQLNVDYWYTIGTLQAFLGKPEEAQRSLTAALDRDDFNSLDARPWTLFGEICQLYELADTAKAAYAKAKTRSTASPMAKWALSIAASNASKLTAQH